MERFEVKEDCAAMQMHCATPGPDTGYALPEPRAFCALSSEPLPACIGRGSVCDGNVDVVCADGFPARREDCAASQRVCAQVLDIATFCAVAATPDPRCVAGAEWVCDGDTMLSCMSGYALREKPCAGCTIQNGGPVFDILDSSGKSCL
jgi:hypothetical protein